MSVYAAVCVISGSAWLVDFLLTGHVFCLFVCLVLLIGCQTFTLLVAEYFYISSPLNTFSYFFWGKCSLCGNNWSFETNFYDVLGENIASFQDQLFLTILTKALELAQTNDLPPCASRVTGIHGHGPPRPVCCVFHN
jgi:hypothetical protein